MAPLKRLLKLDNDVREIDFRFTDMDGKLNHMTYDVAIIDTDIMTEGFMIDRSPVTGSKTAAT
jgi:glutamine synthetase